MTDYEHQLDLGGNSLMLGVNYGFAKGYAPTFSKEVYAIRDRKPNYPAPFYKT